MRREFSGPREYGRRRSGANRFPLLPMAIIILLSLIVALVLYGGKGGGGLDFPSLAGQPAQPGPAQPQGQQAAPEVVDPQPAALPSGPYVTAKAWMYGGYFVFVKQPGKGETRICVDEATYNSLQIHQEVSGGLQAIDCPPFPTPMPNPYQ